MRSIGADDHLSLIRTLLRPLWRNGLLKKVLPFFFFPYFIVGKRSRLFTLHGKTYRYFYHPYNYTWMNERSVEMAVVSEFVKQSFASNILEIGNVLSHYLLIRHDVVDRYERAPGVINADIVDYDTVKRYDLIISISTLEHVGRDEIPRQDDKVVLAFEHMKSLLTENGKIVITVPIGYNRELDTAIWNNQLGLTQRSYLKRVSTANAWQEADGHEVRNVVYPTISSRANAIVIGVYDRSAGDR